jgi:lipoprotein-releasing system permease protein
MNIAKFLAQKIRFTKNLSFSSLIIKVGMMSIAIAVSVLIISFFVLLGFKNQIKEKLFSLSSHIQVNKITLNRSFDEGSIPNNQDLFFKIKQNENVESVSRSALKSVILKSTADISGVVLKGIDANYDWRPFDDNIILGRKLNLRSDSVSNELIISKKTAETLNLNLNDNVLIYFIQNPPRARKMKIVGIYESNVEELDQMYIMGDLNLIRKINSWNENEFGHFEILVKDFTEINNTKKQLLDALPQEYEVLKIDEILPQFFDWFNLLDRNIILVITLIILVAGFNMVSVLLIMIMERTPMIGLLKSLGSSDNKIRRIFLYNSSRIIIKGQLLGNIIAFIISFIQYRYKIIKLDATNYYMDSVPIQWNWYVVVGVNLGVFVLVLFITILPTILVKRISPVEALKYKD